MEQGIAYQYKQGVGILNHIPFRVLNAGHFKVAEKVVGKKGLLNTGDKIYTGFNPAYAKFITQEAKYLAVFDYDTDVQLDIHQIFAEGTTKEPDRYLLEKKIMAGSMWNAAKRTRDMRNQKPWWQNINLIGFIMLCVVAMVYIVEITHFNPNFITVTVKVVNGTYTQAVNNPNNQGGGIINSTAGIINSTLHAGSHIP